MGEGGGGKEVGDDGADTGEAEDNEVGMGLLDLG